MRAWYVQPDESLTPFGQWLAARAPHWLVRRAPWGKSFPEARVVRVFGGLPYYRFVIFDFTRLSARRGDWGLTILGWSLRTLPCCRLP
jgi:hypothetical protein